MQRFGDTAMGEAVGGLFDGGAAKKMRRQMEAQQAEQTARQSAIDGGLKALREGGKRGQLAWLEGLATELGSTGGTFGGAGSRG